MVGSLPLLILATWGYTGQQAGLWVEPRRCVGLATWTGISCPLSTFLLIPISLCCPGVGNSLLCPQPWCLPSCSMLERHLSLYPSLAGSPSGSWQMGLAHFLPLVCVWLCPYPFCREVGNSFPPLTSFMLLRDVQILRMFSACCKQCLANGSSATYS